MSDGDTASASARLSKPWLDPSAGSRTFTSTSIAEQIADRVGVLGAVQPMQRRRDQGRVGIDGLVEPLLELRCKGVERRALGAASAAGRHHPRANLLDDLFPRLGVGSDASEVERVERQAGDLGALVVAAETVLREERRFRGRGRRRSRSGLRRLGVQLFRAAPDDDECPPPR